MIVPAAWPSTWFLPLVAAPQSKGQNSHWDLLVTPLLQTPEEFRARFFWWYPNSTWALRPCCPAAPGGAPPPALALQAAKQPQERWRRGGGVAAVLQAGNPEVINMQKSRTSLHSHPFTRVDETCPFSGLCPPRLRLSSLQCRQPPQR